MKESKFKPSDAAHFISAFLLALREYYSDKDIIKMFGKERVKGMLGALDEAGK